MSAVLGAEKELTLAQGSRTSMQKKGVCIHSARDENSPLSDNQSEALTRSKGQIKHTRIAGTG